MTFVPLTAPWVALVLAGTVAIMAERPIRVLDGDTVRSDGITYRLVGYDAPETGTRAHCAAERDLGEAAKRRLQQLLRTDDATLTPVRCACRSGTEGSMLCNFGRSCAELTVAGADVAAILIAEGLARPYRCGDFSCPRRTNWCGDES